MAENDFSGESPENYKEKTICCFVVDVSGSMSGTPIKELNNGLQAFYKEIESDRKLSQQLEVAIVTFNEKTETILQPSLVKNFKMPTLTAGGTTAMVDGARSAIELVLSRKEWYKTSGQPYKRPWIVLMTDGVPDPGQDVLGLSLELNRKTADKNFAFLAIGVEGANMDILEKLAGNKVSDISNFDGTGALKLKGLKFAKFFKWLQNSIELLNMSGNNNSSSDPEIGDIDWEMFKL